MVVTTSDMPRFAMRTPKSTFYAVSAFTLVMLRFLLAMPYDVPLLGNLSSHICNDDYNDDPQHRHHITQLAPFYAIHSYLRMNGVRSYIPIPP